MHFCRGGKTFRFLETKSVMKVNSGLSGLHRPSSQHTYGQRQTESETLNSLHTWGNNLEQGTKFQHSAHSLSQRGMGWCHVPSAWQTAVKDSSVRLPCIHTQKKKKKQEKKTLLAAWSLIFPSHNTQIPFPHTKILSQLPVFLLLSHSTVLQLLASPLAAFFLSCVCYRLQIMHKEPKCKQPATIKTWEVWGADGTESQQQDGNEGR